MRDRSRSATHSFPIDTGWLIVGGVLLIAIAVALFRPRRSRVPDLGAFSDHWLAQHQSSTHDPH